MNLSYCGELVRRHDPDRFLLSLYAPSAKREALWALYALNHEIAKTREIVTETQLGLIRLQWWRDALAGIYERDQVLKHQVVEPLAEAINRYGLPRDLFDALIYAREFDLEDRLPSNLDGMIKYAEFTSLPLMQLSLRVLGAIEGETAVRSVATRYAMIGLLRAVPFHLSQQRCYLPEDMIAAEGISVHDLYDATGIKKLSPVIEKVCVEVSARALHGKGKFLQRHAKLAEMYRRQIEKAGYDVFSPRLKLPPFLREIRLLFPGL